jgi:hypothetical protein
MIVGFYLVLILFILNEIFYFSNRKRLDLFFTKKDPSKIKKIDIFYYLIKVTSVPWPIIGLFSSFSGLFSVVILLSIFKFLLYHISKRFYGVYVNIYPILIISVYLTILFYKFS